MPPAAGAFIQEFMPHTPIIDEVDVCVLGGSCTGVFAAVRAARLGARVTIVERLGSFGGSATLSLVNLWHSCLDEVYERPIFRGLTVEVMERLRQRGAVREQARSWHYQWAFNSAELQIELDELVREAGVIPRLHTLFVAPHLRDGKLDAVVVEDKSGRRAIRARQFIDATGDSDLAARLGLPVTGSGAAGQPATTCAIFGGWGPLMQRDWQTLVRQHGGEVGLPEAGGWGCFLPGGADSYMLAATRAYHVDCADAGDLTRAEMEGRRQVRAIMDLLRCYAPDIPLTLQALPARLGIRETRHIRCRHHLTGDELLHGRRFDDAIANGSYPVDIHHQDKPGVTWRFLDGREDYFRPGHSYEAGRWRPVTAENPTFYQIPYRSLLPDTDIPNLLLAGRMIDADPVAYGAIRVMVNLNQTGEAAGTAAVLALRDDCPVADVDPAKLRRTLVEHGSVIL